MPRSRQRWPRHRFRHGKLLPIPSPSKAVRFENAPHHDLRPTTGRPDRNAFACEARHGRETKSGNGGVRQCLVQGCTAKISIYPATKPNSWLVRFIATSIFLTLHSRHPPLAQKKWRPSGRHVFSSGGVNNYSVAPSVSFGFSLSSCLGAAAVSAFAPARLVDFVSFSRMRADFPERSRK